MVGRGTEMNLYRFACPWSVGWSFAVMAESADAARAAIDALIQAEEMHPDDMGDYQIYGWPDSYTMSVHAAGAVVRYSTRPDSRA